MSQDVRFLCPGVKRESAISAYAFMADTSLWCPEILSVDQVQCGCDDEAFQLQIWAFFFFRSIPVGSEIMCCFEHSGYWNCEAWKSKKDCRVACVSKLQKLSVTSRLLISKLTFNQYDWGSILSEFAEGWPQTPCGSVIHDFTTNCRLANCAFCWAYLLLMHTFFTQCTVMTEDGTDVIAVLSVLLHWDNTENSILKTGAVLVTQIFLEKTCWSI